MAWPARVDGPSRREAASAPKGVTPGRYQAARRAGDEKQSAARPVVRGLPVLGWRRETDMFEHRADPLLPRPHFFRRQLLHGAASGLLIGAALGLGILGYHAFEKLSWIDSLLNASMILGGMGPVDPVKTEGGKLFASFYALFSGIVFLVAAGVVFAPAFHRFLHRFHLELEDEGTRPEPGAP